MATVTYFATSVTVNLIIIPIGGLGGISIMGGLGGGGTGTICGGSGRCIPDGGTPAANADTLGTPGGGGGGRMAEDEGGPEVGVGPILSPGLMMPSICCKCLIWSATVMFSRALRAVCSIEEE